MKMSTVVLIAGLALTSVALAANATFTSKSEGFSVNYPSTWESVSGIKGPVMLYRETKAKIFSSNVNVVVVKIKGVNAITTADIPVLTKSTLGVIAKTITNYKEIKREATTLGGQPAAAYTYTGDSGNSKGLQWYQVQTIYKEKGYTLTFTTAASKFVAAKPVFDAIKNSFKFQ
jgi:hypothetical protein